MKGIFTTIILIIALYSCGGSDEPKKEKPKYDMGQHLKIKVAAYGGEEFKRFEFYQLAGYKLSTLISKDEGRINEWKNGMKNCKFIKEIDVEGLKGRMYVWTNSYNKKKTYYTVFEEGNKYMSVDSEGIRGYDYFMAIKESKKIWDNYEKIKIDPEGKKVYEPKIDLTQEEIDKLEKMWYIVNDRYGVPGRLQDLRWNVESWLESGYIDAKATLVSMKYYGVGELVFETEWKFVLRGKNAFGGTVENIKIVKVDRYGNAREI